VKRWLKCGGIGCGQSIQHSAFSRHRELTADG